jgi:outer membrane protein
MRLRKGKKMIRKYVVLTGVVCLASQISLSHVVFAQLATRLDNAQVLPSAPEPQNPSTQDGAARSEHHIAVSVSFPPALGAYNPSSISAQAPAPVPAAIATARLTRTQAEQLAMKNNPQISVGHLLALAQHQVYREARAAELPNFNGSMTAVQANEGSRIGAGSLTASRLLVHAGAGVVLSQLLTDFGRTINLVSSSKLQEKAQNANALATTEDIVLATDQAFYNALQAQALLKVAQQTVTTRQSIENQVDQLAKNKLKSDLDLSFAQVNLSQAKLLQLDAQNNVDSTTAALSAVLGFDTEIRYELADDETQAPPPPPDVDVLINSAMQQRPDLRALTFNQQAAERFHKAQRDQFFPTISALGMAGASPVRPDCVADTPCAPNYFVSSWYGAVGVNMSVPIFDGFLFTAQSSEANLRAKAAAENTRNLRDQVARDVRTAWLAANTAFQKVGVAEELEKQADLAMNYAQGRYKLGLASIVELSQGQLQQTDAAIGYVMAQYQYRLALSTLNFEIGVQP